MENLRKDTTILRLWTRDILVDTTSDAPKKMRSGELQKLMEDSVQVIAALGGKRDPYTASHQLRVAGLASAIATEMQFPDDWILGLKLAASIHDVGKILVPFEILSRPGKLSAMELNIVREHAQMAHDILNNMDFYWPVSQIIYQHHERLDGSGYPRGLRGESILYEARILAVADVVEAMSSDRPYRPALGTGRALQEINTQKGKLYDAPAVDACTRLFQVKGYRFDN
jgi:HD-GYP domain-containing protein (c-di-GMP phosphodiesterase class II)